jgi:hypothetical protein
MHDLKTTENNTTDHQQTAGDDFHKCGAPAVSAAPIADIAPLPAAASALPTREPPAPIRRKRCRSCGYDLPIAEVYRQRNCLDAHRLDCKSCIRERNKQTRHDRAAAESAARQTLECKRCHRMKPVTAFTPDSRYRRGYREICVECRASAEEEAAARDLNLPDDPHLPPSARRIDLGLAIAQATCPPGYCRSCEEIAAFTGLTVDAVRKIERRALAKLRRAADRLLREAIAAKRHEKERE